MDPPSRREALVLLYERHYAELVWLAFALTSDWCLAGGTRLGGVRPRLA